MQGNFEEVATLLVESGADPNDIYTDEKGKEHNLLFDSVTLGNEVRRMYKVWSRCDGVYGSIPPPSPQFG